MIRLKLFLGGLIACATLSAQQAPTTKSFMEEVSALKQRVAALELRLAKLETRPEPPRPPSEPLAFDRPKSPSDNTKGFIGNIKSSGNSLIEELRNGFSSTNRPAQGAWTKPENWLKIQKGMASGQVEQVLGKPYAQKKSIKLRVDNYWLYIGKLPSGNTLQGRVRFYKGKVSSFDIPKF